MRSTAIENKSKKTSENTHPKDKPDVTDTNPLITRSSPQAATFSGNFCANCLPCLPRGGCRCLTEPRRGQLSGGCRRRLIATVRQMPASAELAAPVLADCAKITGCCYGWVWMHFRVVGGCMCRRLSLVLIA